MPIHAVIRVLSRMCATWVATVLVEMQRVLQSVVSLITIALVIAPPARSACSNRRSLSVFGGHRLPKARQGCVEREQRRNRLSVGSPGRNRHADVSPIRTPVHLVVVSSRHSVIESGEPPFADFRWTPCSRLRLGGRQLELREQQ